MYTEMYCVYLNYFYQIFCSFCLLQSLEPTQKNKQKIPLIHFGSLGARHVHLIQVQFFLNQSLNNKILIKEIIL